MSRALKNFIRVGLAAASLGTGGCAGYRTSYQEKPKEINYSREPPSRKSEMTIEDYERLSIKQDNEANLAAARTANKLKFFGEASKLYEKAGLLYCAAEAAEKAGDPSRALELYEKTFDEEWKSNREGLGMEINIKLLRSLMKSKRSDIKEKVVEILESGGRYSLAGDFSLEMGDKKRAFGNYKNARINAVSMAQLAFDIAKDAEKQGEWSKVVRYLNEAEGLNGDETGEIKWIRERVLGYAKSDIESLVEEGDLLKAAKMARDIGDEEKAKRIEQINQDLKKKISQGIGK